ncbi:MAG TPA: toll/interleukin-1 receptor domain-containing protein [Myxococcales bacterium]
MARFILRGHGPRTFISYSFRDSALAKTIEDFLSDRGFQVTREDETSLADRQLTEEIPRRIAKAEVLIQLRTANSNTSQWIAREFQYAIDSRKKGQSVTLLPVVFDKATLPDPVKEWWFLDAGEAALTHETLEQIERICLRSVHLLPLAEEDPLSFDEPALVKMLEALPADGKRVIADSGATLLRWVQDALEYVTGLDSDYKDQFLAQERRRFEKLLGWQKSIDEVVRKLAIETLAVMEGYTDKAIQDARLPMNRFARIVFGHLVLDAERVAPPPPHPLRTRYKARVQEARAANTNSHSEGYLNPGFYAWAFADSGQVLEDWGESFRHLGYKTRMARMRLDAPGFQSIPIQIPSAVFGSMEDAYTRMPGSFDPRGELFTGTFLKYVLPQIAVHAAFNVKDGPGVRNELEQRYAWKLDQYRSMGLD